ncbi:hypothetical protein RV01_GL000482 [Enterococcus dispar]|nr:hypothetical protein RV01_GL000482 [Enterococcus dispar]
MGVLNIQKFFLMKGPVFHQLFDIYGYGHLDIFLSLGLVI